MRAGGDDGGIERVVAVAAFAFFYQAPAGTQKGGELAIDHHTTAADAAICASGKLQVVFNVVFEKAADVAGVVEIARAKFACFFFVEMLAQQTVALGLC